MFRLLLVVSTTTPEIPLTCFYGADDLKGRVVDLTNQMTWNNKHEVVKKCAELAYANGYQRFALGKNGLCLSGVNIKDKYYLNGVENAACIDRIGAGNSIFVYSFGKFMYLPIPSVSPSQNVLQIMTGTRSTERKQNHRLTKFIS